MNTYPDYFKSLADQKKKKNYLKNTVEKYLFHWPLFVLGLVIALGLAFLYMDIAKPTYLIRATLLIKDDKKSGDPKSEMLDEIGITNSSESVENEIEILSSKTVISKVVNDLQLWTTYIQNDGLQKNDLYHDSPVKLLFLNRIANNDPQNINIIIKDDKSFLLKDAEGNMVNVPFSKSYNSPFGTWKLAPTATLANFKGASIRITAYDPDQTTHAYQKLIDVSLANKLATTISFSISDNIPQRGKDILNSVIANYNLFSAIDKNDETKRTLDFLDQRIDSLSKELTASEKGIEGFKSARGITDIDAASKMQLENVQTNDNNLNQVKIQLDIINGVERYINSNQSSEKAPATVGIVDPALSNSIEKLALLQLQHDKLAATMPETNPDFDPINSQIKSAKTSIKENVKNIKQSLLSTEAKLQSFSSNFESTIKSMPEKERQYISIKREQTSKESLYTFLLQSREDVSVKYASNLTNNRVVDVAYAEPPSDPKMIILFFAVFFGLATPFALIYGRNKLSRKITDVEDITDVVDMPVVAELPYQKTKDAGSILDINSNTMSEQLRALRINLFNLHNTRETGRVTLLTSSVSGEGKSFLSVNLSAALAFSYRKTVILELDMRKPKVGKLFNLEQGHKGISEYLYNKATLDEIIQPSKIENLDIITCGGMINNPSESLEKMELRDLISKLRETYDDVIIDSPPIHLVPDAAILSRLSDITLYVIRQGVTDKVELGYIKQLSEQKQLTNIYIVFNAIERMKHGYGYRYDQSYYGNAKTGFLDPIFGDFGSRF